MRFLIAIGMGAVLLAGCRGPSPAARPPRTPPPAVAVRGTEPDVRVGVVVDTTEVSITSERGFDITTAGGTVLARARAGEVWRFAGEGTAVVARSASGSVTPQPGQLFVRPPEGALIEIAGKPYRGGAFVRLSAPGRVTAVNVLALETYLLGVVPAEIPSLALEAVKAQAVAARTYAVGHMGRRDALGFDFFASVSDQVYGGAAREDTMASRAVRETRGEIVTYEGAPILAYYHSTCGGRTAAMEEVWPRGSQPYLRSVSDARPGGDGWYCDASNRFRWQEDWTRDELLGILRATLREHFGAPEVTRIEELRLEGRTRSGRAERLVVRADGRDYQARGDSIRWVLRPEPNRILNSALIELRSERADGAVTYAAVSGGGWGHGIGMCQMGAIGRARAGQDYRAILTTYYQGARVQRLY